MKQPFTTLCLLAFSGILSLNAMTSDTGSRMNVIIILADDLGWMDCSSYGSQYYETPHIDQLAAGGIRFTQAYAANPLCSPTRASILTGRYPSRFHLTSATGHLPSNPDELFGLRKEAPAWQKVLTPVIRNYLPLEELTLAEILKAEGYVTAHMGKWHLGDSGYYPEYQGFDVNVAGYNLGWPRSYFSPYRNEKISDGDEGEYLTDRLTDEAIRFIEANRETPFFLNLWYFAVHTPLHAKHELVEKYQAKEDPRGRQNFAVMGAMIETLDQNIGRLMSTLKDLGLMDNTLVVFTSDNGGVEHLVYQGQIVTDNHPLRYGKGNIHEGGIRVPFILHSRDFPKDEVCHRTVCTVDLLPTILHSLDIQPPKDLELDGEAIQVILKHPPQSVRPGVFIDFPHYIIGPENYPSIAMISDTWKLIRIFGEGITGDSHYKLYDIRKDPGEFFNRALEFPEIVEEMNFFIDKHMAEVSMEIPLKNPAFDPKIPNPMGTYLKTPRVLIK